MSDIYCKFYTECYSGHKCEQALTQEILAGNSNKDIETYEVEPACFEEKDLSIISNLNNG